LSSTDSADPALLTELAAPRATEPAAAALHNALGLAITRAGQGQGPITAPLAAQAAGHFRHALEADPQDVIAGLNLAEALVGIEQGPEAVQVARRTLAVLTRLPGLPAPLLEAPHFPPAFDLFRVEWERAAWANAGCPVGEGRAKCDLLRWRLHALLATLTGDLSHYYEAVFARPDLPLSRAALGCALGRAGRPAEALPHLRYAVEHNPFDREAARALLQVLHDAGDADGERRLAREQRLLSQAAPQLVPAAPWFHQEIPVGDELATLIILCCNEVECTRLCLESVLRHTRAPYEIVLVDNGSTDATAAYLEEIKARPGPERVVIIRNATNRGFPAGCNQGLAEARGEFVIFLNNDTVVTPGWLDGLVRWALHDWPRVGLVGAVTNYTAAPQQVDPGYTDLADLDAFAARRAREYAGKALQVPRLTGFCLLAPRAVLQQIGRFDERFGLGLFDDDDLCVRVRSAGLRLLVALGVYIHHFGSRTFQSLGIDCQKQLLGNFALFKDKWGPAEAAHYRLPAPATTDVQSGVSSQDSGLGEDTRPALPAPTAVVPVTRGETPARKSLCIIARNEEANLADCLRSAADLFDEVILLDTGSTDRTKEIAAEFGARVFDFAWCDSFSEARNECLRHATGDWIFWLDADDRLDEENRGKLADLLAGLNGDNAAYSMKCLCLPDPVHGTSTVVDHVRLFRNRSENRWEYRVHEQILPALRRSGAEIRWSDVVIRHTGYQDPALRRRKLDRDLRLLQLENQERPAHPFILFNLGGVYAELGLHAEALTALRHSLASSDPRDSIVRKLYALIVQCHRELGQTAEAEAACQAGRSHYPDDTELLFQEGLLRRANGDPTGAIAAFRRLQASQEAAHFASIDTGLRGYKARHNLAVVYYEQGQPAEAEAEWQAALQEQPDFFPSLLGLGEVYLSQQRWPDLERVCARLEEMSPAGVDAAVLQARGHMARRDFVLARQLLQKAAAGAPHALWPRVYLSHALLQEGEDWDAAERALRDVLSLDLAHAQARHNLSILLAQRERRVAALWPENMTLAALYHAACTTPADIHEHLPTLYHLASRCRHVTEFGTRTGVSTTALLFAQPERLVCYDLVKHAQVLRLQVLAGRTRFDFHKEDVLQAEIEETELLFIDTRHDYDQLKEELRRHAGKVGKYIVLHDTTTYGEGGETPGHQGLWPAVEEFLAEGCFRLGARNTNNNGLTVLEAARA
jgi:GT2 family glycosyltransferase/Flp pilus assembly protein TadD